MKSATIFNKGVAGLPVYQCVAMLLGNLNIISSGMHYGWPSPSLPKLLDEESHIEMSSDEGGWVAIIVLFGAVCGSIVGAITLDIIGRKNLILASSVPFIASWLMIAFATSVEVILGARFLAGISDGLIFCSIPTYLGEIANPGIRGLFGSGVAVTWIFGILFINILGSYLSIQMTALISAAVPLLLLITFCWMPESPYYLIMKGRMEEAKKSLVIFKGTEDVDDELERLTHAVQEQNTNTGRYLDLFTVKSNRKALYIMMGSRGAQQLTGTIPIMFYAQIIFKEAGDSISPSSSSVIYFGMQLLFAGLSSAIVDRTGRRPLMIISIIGAAIALFAQGSYFYIQTNTDIDTSQFSLIPIIALIFFVIAFSIGLQTVPILLLAELFPTNVKAFAVSFADLYFAVITTIISKYFQITKDSFGLYVPFFSFTACCLLTLVFTILWVPETKGKTLEEIQDELKEKKEVAIELQDKFSQFEPA